jgi:hypothetical protein
MSETHRWLETRRRELLGRHLGAGAAVTLGLLLGALGVGLVLGRVGVYRHAPWSILVAWAVPLLIVGVGAAWIRRRARRFSVLALANLVERAGGRRRGWVAGAAAWTPLVGSPSLAALADRQVASWLRQAGQESLAAERGAARGRVVLGVSVLLAGVATFAAAGPAGPGARFWQPAHVLAMARAPVRLEVDRTTVARGGRVSVRVTAPGRAAAELWVRAPGEAWQRQPLVLDTAGTTAVTLGPLESDRYLKAASGRRFSRTVHVTVSLPALVAELEILASFPTYLGRPAERLVADGDTVRLPMGTNVATRGRLTVPLAAARWESSERTTELAVAGTRFTGAFVVRGSAAWRLVLHPEHGGDILDEGPALTIVALQDSIPTVAVPVPGVDTIAPLSLEQPLLVDVRDDHGITRVELVSWRVSRLGQTSDPETQVLRAPDSSMARAVIQTTLDLNSRGFLPGDTAYFQVRAFDNAPTRQLGVSRVFRLRLASMAELRRAMREASRAAGASADSLVREQQDLVRRLEDLAAERERSAATGGAEQGERLPFESAERARELLDAERDLTDRAQQLGDEVRQLADAAWEAGITDPEFHRQLRDIQDLMRRAVTPDLLDRLAELQQAVDRLDAADVREALRQLSSAADQLRESLERGRDLFERAAIEGELTTLSAEADDLAQEQDAWNVSLHAPVERSAADEEQARADRTRELEQRLDELAQMLDSAGVPSGQVASGGDRAGEAARAMDRAASGAEQGDAQRARQAGTEASEALDPVGAALRQERDRLREEWRQEVLAEMDQALVETVALAKTQETVEGRLRRGESGVDIRGEQAAIREGVDRIVDRMQATAGKNALVSPQLGAALGLARLRMDEALDQLQRPSPNTRDAGTLAGEAVDALTEAVYAMIRGRGDVAGAESGSGLAEALERMAELASEQGQMNGQAAGLLPTFESGGAQLMQELQALAARQQALARELEQLRADGELRGTGELADEADEIAEQLRGGRLDSEILERQERLFRRLLDAGRTLESDEEDERRERVAESARPDNVRRPTDADVSRGAVRYRYPSWTELRALTPEQRRLILEYFRRLNAPRP